MVTKKEEKNQCRTLIITLINTLIFVVVLTHKNKQEHFRVFLGLFWYSCFSYIADFPPGP